ncbi:nuclear speckle splicing regulatory protein 1-like [Tribolium madens]|uniref:nuclear speckle splicing regulatory protein 1-like n=1 Tax=Tribolium madens TaxID=41895 RepID=UPI001CF71D7B|nr:nuclear speckle splicing regulatory protein 1-like [Tribolium madens]
MKFVVILFVFVFVALTNEALATEQHHSKSGEAAGKQDEKGAKHSEFNHVKKSGKSSKHDVEKARKGQSLNELHKKVNAEKKGKKTKYHAKDGYKSLNEHSGGSGHGAKFQEAAKKKKLNYKKGYREQYHKDEHKKHNTFYSNSHKSGEFEVFGQKHKKYNSKYSAKKQVENHKLAKDQNDYKKASKKAGGHDMSEKKAFKDQKATKSHHNHQEKWAKKGGKKGGKQYKYKIVPKQ